MIKIIVQSFGTRTSLWGAPRDCHASLHWHCHFPLLWVHPHQHMLPCVAVPWRTQSTSYPQLSLVTVSGLCGRTGSDRMDCCVIDFNLESAACCFPPLFPSWQGPCWPPAAAYLWGKSLIALLQKTHLREVAGSGVLSFISNILLVSHITSSSLSCSHLTKMIRSTWVSTSNPILHCLLPARVDRCWRVKLLEAVGTKAPNIWRCAGCAHRLDTLSWTSQILSMRGKKLDAERHRILHRKNNWPGGESSH